MPVPTRLSREIISKSTSEFCYGQYTLVTCPGSTKIAISKAIFAVDLGRHCEKSQTDVPIGETIYFSAQNFDQNSQEILKNPAPTIFHFFANSSSISANVNQNCATVLPEFLEKAYGT